MLTISKFRGSSLSWPEKVGWFSKMLSTGVYGGRVDAAGPAARENFLPFFLYRFRYFHGGAIEGSF